ncbi:MAG: hypothetical protein IJS90_05455 [Clostridia bacterium]|nr:hypothetical protein [Clostridia bacterium]
MYQIFIKVLTVISAFIMLFTSPGGHIRQPLEANRCPNYYGSPAEINYLGEVEGFKHPYLAKEGTNGMHGNSYNTGAYSYVGPLGIDPVVKSRSMNVFGGLVATLMFDSQGRIMCISGNVVGFRLLLMDADSLEILAETRLPQRASTREFFRTLDFSKISSDTSGGAYCHLLEGDRPLIGNSDNVIQIYYVDESSGTPQWKVEKEWAIGSYLPEGAYLTDAIPDYEGNIWFVTRPGQVGYVEPDSGEVHVMSLENEEIQNTLAVCADGIYIVSDYAMYRFEIGEDGLPVYTWRTLYDRGSSLKPGAINQGSGTTPTLLDCPRADGTTAHLVAITDNADDRVHVVVYERETGKVLAEEPVFESGHSVSENSLIAFGRSFIVENNYTDTGSGFLETNPTGYPGVTRIDMNENCDGCTVAWESDEASCTVVPKLSTGNGLVYLYTREMNDDIPKNAVAWYLTAIDFETGETVYKVFTGCGRNWNNSYGPITIGPNGTLYVGVFNGLVSVSDAK